MNYKTDLEHANRVNALLDEAYSCRVNDLSKSIELATEALELSKKLDETTLIARSKSRLSLFHMIRGEYEMSMRFSNEAIGLFQVISDEQGIADSKFNIASIYYKTDNFHLALFIRMPSAAVLPMRVQRQTMFTQESQYRQHRQPKD